MSRDRPILMHRRSVHNILEGRKTQTRRPVKKGPDDVKSYLMQTEAVKRNRAYAVPTGPGGTDWRNLGALVDCPYGDIGDTLWVRETFRVVGLDRDRVSVKHAADETVRTVRVKTRKEREQAARAFKNTGWSPSIHMPRWASRITLLVEDIRIDQVQDISVEDIRAEGVRPNMPLDEMVDSEEEYVRAWRKRWKRLWNDTWDHEPQYQWDENPWCWIVEFSVEDVKGRP